MEEKTQTPMKAIRAKCLDCCCGSPVEVAECPCTDCSLHIYRFGHNPAIKRGMSDEQKAAKAEIMKAINAKKRGDV